MNGLANQGSQGLSVHAGGQGHRVEMSFETLMASSGVSAKARKKNKASAKHDDTGDMYEEYAKMVADFKAKQQQKKEVETLSRRLQVTLSFSLSL